MKRPETRDNVATRSPRLRRNSCTPTDHVYKDYEADLQPSERRIVKHASAILTRLAKDHNIIESNIPTVWVPRQRTLADVPCIGRRPRVRQVTIRRVVVLRAYTVDPLKEVPHR